MSKTVENKQIIMEVGHGDTGETFSYPNMSLLSTLL